MKFESKIMNLKFKKSIGCLSFKALEEYEFVKHAFVTRLGGVSQNQFAQMNLNSFYGDNPENVEKNYEILCDAFNIESRYIALSKQVHGNSIKAIKKEDILNQKIINSRLNLHKFEENDGFITNDPNVTLMTFHADCPAVYMFDPVKKVVGLAHAGWRGTVKKIAGNLFEAFIKSYGSGKNDIICALGPSIGNCCFEVSADILPEFESLGIQNSFVKLYNPDGKMKIDLLDVNRQILMQCGAREENIFISDICTMCNRDLLFSYRATKGMCGGNAAILSINQ